MRKRGTIFLTGFGLAILAFLTLAPIIPPPGATGSTGPQGSPGISGSPGPQGSPGPAVIGGEIELNPVGTSINLNSTTAQDVYTVPVGKKLLVTKALWHTLTGADNWGDGDTTTFLVITSSNASTIISCSQVSLLNNFLIGHSVNGSLVIAAGDKVQAKPNTAWGDTVTAKVVVFGYLFDA